MSKERFPVPEKHQILLRDLLRYNFTFIYIGDEIEVSERWAGNGENPHKGNKGTVTDIIRGIQGDMNVEYTIYRINCPGKDNAEIVSEMYHYTLNRTKQTKTNKKLEEFLRETL